MFEESSKQFFFFAIMEIYVWMGPIIVRRFVRVHVRASVRACVRTCVCVCVFVLYQGLLLKQFGGPWLYSFTINLFTIDLFTNLLTYI